MARRAEISGRLRVDRRQFSEDLAKAKGEAQNFANGLKGLGGVQLGGSGGRGGWLGNLANIQAGLSMAGKGASAAKTALSAFFKADASAESLARGLGAVSDGTETVRYQMEQLGKLAEQPGVGSRATAAQASIQLQAVGLSAEQSRRTIAAFANEAANMNLPEEGLQEVVVSLRQMAKTTVDMQNLKEIFSRLPRLADMVDGLDKKDPLKFIKALTAELEKQPKSMAGTREKIDGMKDSWNQFLSGTSKGRVAGAFAGGADVVTRALQGDYAGAISSIGVNGKKVLSGEADDPLAKFEPSAEELARRKKAKEDAEWRREQEKKYAGINKYAEAVKGSYEMIEKENELAVARVEADAADVAELEDQLDLMKELAQLGDTVAGQEDIVEMVVRRQNMLRREGLEQVKKIEAAAESAAAWSDLELSMLKANGQVKRAQRMEEEREQARLIKAGLSEEQAKARVDAMRANDEDGSTFSRYGRRRIRRMNPDNPWAVRSDKSRRQYRARYDDTAWGLDRAKESMKRPIGASLYDEGSPLSQYMDHGSKQKVLPGSAKRADLVERRASLERALAGGGHRDGPGNAQIIAALRDIENAIKGTVGPKDRITK